MREVTKSEFKRIYFEVGGCCDGWDAVHWNRTFEDNPHPGMRLMVEDQVIAMDGMYVGFSGVKTGHRGPAFSRYLILLIRHFVLVPFATFNRCHQRAVLVRAGGNREHVLLPRDETDPC